MGIIRFICNIFAIGFVLASAGTAVEAIHALKHEAVRVHRQGIISIGAWNRALQSGASYHSIKTKMETRHSL